MVCKACPHNSWSEQAKGQWISQWGIEEKLNTGWSSAKEIFAGFAGTNIIFIHSNLTGFKDQINIVIEQISSWFQTNSLILNFNKTHYIQFMAKSKLAVDAHISYKDNPINITSCTNFRASLWIAHYPGKHISTS